MKVFCFLCDLQTEQECLSRALVGTTLTNADWALQVGIGDLVCLYNFQTGDIWGAFNAASSADCYERDAWGGKFPLQVRIAKTAESRKCILTKSTVSGLFVRQRPRHVIEGELARNLMLWMHRGEKF